MAASVNSWCGRCRKFTRHWMDTGGRIGGCVECYAPYSVETGAGQAGLFDQGSGAAQQVSESASQPAAAAVASVATQEQACDLSREFAEACDEAGFQYRGYSDVVGDREYCYSKVGAPGVVFFMKLSRWDHTPAMLAREATRLEKWM